jgi:hemerythrin
MRVNNYPQRETHENEHRLLQRKVLKMKEEQYAGAGPRASELLTFLCDWLLDHVTTADKELGVYLKRTRG